MVCSALSQRAPEDAGHPDFACGAPRAAASSKLNNFFYTFTAGAGVPLLCRLRGSGERGRRLLLALPLLPLLLLLLLPFPSFLLILHASFSFTPLIGAPATAYSMCTC